ncbi:MULTISPECIES: alpha/beta hydrolase [Streptomyces]|uniref:Alpha/beta hydrolase n=1 Tax=Streptomyces edwardsiae TaxID=3075527 RepID=A0ABU2QKW5_9ACTN|nr:MULTISPECIES: alpha/beta hydrolase [unclassified Streptomyces]MDT0405099.1 alpha/beta hydrolase [Streptomyces sp. DSM 41635]
MSGFIMSVVLLALCTFAAVRPPMPRHSSRSNLWFWLGYLINEQPFPGLVLLAASTVPTLSTGVGTPAWWLAAALTAVPACGMVALAVRARSARGVLEGALADGPGIRMVRGRLPLLRVLLLPFVSWRPGVRRLRDRRYGDARTQRLDVYMPRSRPRGAPVLLYLHGGGFVTGSKLLGARPLLHRLAGRGWVCASANYRLRTAYGDSLEDARQAIVWLRHHAGELGADPSRVVVAGGSAGAHLAATVALTDDSISGAIGLYGYYGPAGEGASPHALLHAEAPPFLIVHGSLDTLALSADARRFADELAAVSDAPVAFAELPGTQHNFDYFHSLRLHAVSDAVESFAGWVTRTGHGRPAG